MTSCSRKTATITLTAAPGMTTSRGGIGNDIYVWGKGYGNDTIYSFGEYTELGYVNGVDSVVFGDGLTVASFEFTAGVSNNSDLVIRIKETGETLTLTGWFSLVSDKINRFRFADGTVLTAADIDAQGITVRGTEGNDTLQASFGLNMNLYGLGGNDTLRGASMDRPTLRRGRRRRAVRLERRRHPVRGCRRRFALGRQGERHVPVRQGVGQ